MAHFQIKNLTFAYPDRPNTLEDINLSVEPGEYVVICGQSGSGKTTLLQHFKTVLTPHGKSQGEILLDGIPLAQIPLGEQAAKVGYVMQNPQEQIVTDKVWHELAFGLENIGCDKTVMRSRVAEMACYFGIQDWFHRDTSTLSGGQKQLLNLAAVMAMNPEVLILDEPTSQLDPLAASDFLNTLRKINTELGTTIIITEHRLEDILPYADRVVVLDKGQVAFHDTPRSVGQALWQAQHPIFAAMPTPMQISCRVRSQTQCPLTVREGRKWLNLSLPCPKFTAIEESPTVKRQYAVSIKELWFRYERNTHDVLRGLSGEIPEGSLFAIVGGNGAGKSTMLKALCGICKPYRGKIKARGKVAMLPQEAACLMVKDTVAADLQEMSRDENAVKQAAETCRITHLLDRHPHDLSGGELQRAALAKVLLTDPQIMLLDEPTKGMDGAYKNIFAEILCKLTNQGKTVIMVSHDVEFCARHADFVSMFFDGQLLTTDTARRFFSANSFYTTAANRMSRSVFQNAVTVEDVVSLCERNREV